jgi:plastocyanin
MTAAAQGAGRGTIKGHIRLTGKLPGNPIIRMGLDPMCARITAGKRVIQEYVKASRDGSLANVFVKLQGSFPATPVPVDPVTIDQAGCIYVPRVIGVRTGQTIRIKNSDSLLHNVHGSSSRSNGFNFGQPKAGMTSEVRPKEEETMVHLQCEVHRWMTAYIGVVNHPYFAVSNEAGTFEITGVPAGTHTIRAWHERYGEVSQPVRVRSGATTTVEFTYASTEKPTGKKS